MTARLAGSVARTEDTVLTLSVSGTATKGSTGDYTLSDDGEPGTITIPSGSLSATKTLSITPVADTANEGDETIVVGGAAAGFRVNSATITLLDDDGRPRPPTGVTVASATETSIVVSWTAPEGVGGSAITEWGVRYKRSSATTWTTHAHSGTTTSTTITGLVKGARYDVQVSATNAEGTSGWSASGDGTPLVTLVSSLGQTADSGLIQLNGAINGQVQRSAQPFTTGSQSGGYGISAVDVSIAGRQSAAVVSAGIWEVDDETGAPTSLLHSLTGPATLDANSVNTFTAPDGATLAASTTYALVMESTHSVFVRYTRSDAEDTGAAGGWSLGDTSLARFDDGAWFELNSSGVPLMAVRGVGEAPPAAPDPVTSLTLSVQPATIGEGAEGDVNGDVLITVTATLDGEARALGVPVTLSVDTAASSAARNTDYAVAAALGDAKVDITIPGDQTSASASFKFDPESDKGDEPNETVVITGTACTVMLDPCPALHEFTVTPATLTIIDNNVATITLSLDDQEIGESETNSQFDLTVSRDPAGEARCGDRERGHRRRGLDGRARHGQGLHGPDQPPGQPGQGRGFQDCRLSPRILSTT